jgi:hypothetical protein
LHGGVRIQNLPGVSRILKVIEELRRVHFEHCNVRPRSVRGNLARRSFFAEKLRFRDSVRLLL